LTPNAGLTVLLQLAKAAAAAARKRAPVARDGSEQGCLAARPTAPKGTTKGEKQRAAAAAKRQQKDQLGVPKAGKTGFGRHVQLTDKVVKQ
jgi:hypothetical protein